MVQVHIHIYRLNAICHDVVIGLFAWYRGFTSYIYLSNCDTHYSVALSVYYCEIFKFCFGVFSGDVVVSGGLISIVGNSFFKGPVGFTYVFN